MYNKASLSPVELMTVQTSNGYRIRVLNTKDLGSAWIVQVDRRFLAFHRPVSTDWFLDEAQAKRFAEQLAGELRAGEGIENARNRVPGWTLHRPAR